jgi:hypothetical protein
MANSRMPTSEMLFPDKLTRCSDVFCAKIVANSFTNLSLIPLHSSFSVCKCFPVRTAGSSLSADSLRLLPHKHTLLTTCSGERPPFAPAPITAFPTIWTLRSSSLFAWILMPTRVSFWLGGEGNASGKLRMVMLE